MWDSSPDVEAKPVPRPYAWSPCSCCQRVLHTARIRCWRRWTWRRESSWWPWMTIVITLLSLPAIWVLHAISAGKWTNVVCSNQLPKLCQQHEHTEVAQILLSYGLISEWAADDGGLREVAGKCQEDFYFLFWISVLKAVWDRKHDQQVTYCPVIVTTMDQMFVSPQNSMFKS